MHLRFEGISKQVTNIYKEEREANTEEGNVKTYQDREHFDTPTDQMHIYQLNTVDIIWTYIICI